MLYNDNKFIMALLIIVTKFNVKLYTICILVVRKEFYSDLNRFKFTNNTVLPFHWSINEHDRLTIKGIGRS